MEKTPIPPVYSCPNPYASPSQAVWQRLYEIAPDLRKLYIDVWATNAAPKPLDREMFLSLCACFADPRRREILRALLFDLLADDVIELMTVPEGEGVQ